jgi:hypothetical protein
MTLEERILRIEKWLASDDGEELSRIRANIRASLDAPRDSPLEETAHLSFEQRVALRLLESFPAISADDLGSRVREIRAVVDAPRAEAEPGPAERTVEAAITKASAARVAYGDGRVSVWREIEEVLVGSGTDVTKPIPTRFYPLISESLTEEIDRLESEGIIAGQRVLRSEQWAAGNVDVGGDIQTELYQQGMGALLKACFGAVATTGAGMRVPAGSVSGFDGTNFRSNVSLEQIPFNVSLRIQLKRSSGAAAAWCAAKYRPV